MIIHESKMETQDIPSALLVKIWYQPNPFQRLICTNEDVWCIYLSGQHPETAYILVVHMNKRVANLTARWGLFNFSISKNFSKIDQPRTQVRQQRIKFLVLLSDPSIYLVTGTMLDQFQCQWIKQPPTSTVNTHVSDNISWKVLFFKRFK